MASGGDAHLDRFLKELEEHIGRYWKVLARTLKFSKTDIDAIEYKDKDDLREQIHEFFNKWKMREGNNASVAKLMDALVAARLQGVLDELKDALPDEITQETIPVQESGAATNQKSSGSSQSEFVRQKRLERFSSGGSDKSLPGAATPERLVSRSVSTASSSSTVLEEHEQTSHGATPLSPTSPQVKASPTSSSGPRTEVRKGFEVGDTVKVERKPSPWYGVIRWIGEIPNVSKLTAGIEMEDKVDGGHSGEMNGVQYFTCEEGCGLFLPVSRLQRDDRFDDPPSLIPVPTPEGDEAEKDKEKPSTFSPPSEEPSLADEDKLASQPTTSTPSSGPRVLTFKCPGDQTGLIIGRGGKNIREVESETNTSIQVHRSQFDQGADAKVMIMGSEDNCKKALFLLVRHVREKIALHTATTETIEIPKRLCGRVIGKGGSTLKAIENVSGARIKIDEKKGWEALLDPEGPRECKIYGSAEEIEAAKELIEMAQQGRDVAQAAQIAAHTIRLMKELIKEGFSFPEDIL